MDHLVLGVPDLEHGVEFVERRTGVRARPGGKHPGRGTHNALLSLGERQYLEIIAIDPEQADLGRLPFPGLKSLSQPKFISWAVAVGDIEQLAGRARLAGYEFLGPIDGSRVEPGGSLLIWKALKITAPSLDLIPFFIAWGENTRHPAEDLPAACRLISYRIEHPRPERMREVLRDVGADASVSWGPEPRLAVRVQSPKGETELA
jgi:hypothetical protein